MGAYVIFHALIARSVGKYSDEPRATCSKASVQHLARPIVSDANCYPRKRRVFPLAVKCALLNRSDFLPLLPSTDWHNHSSKQRNIHDFIHA